MLLLIEVLNILVRNARLRGPCDFLFLLVVLPLEPEK